MTSPASSLLNVPPSSSLSTPGPEGWLAEASALLSASLDYDTTLDALPRLLVPRLADGCSVLVLGADGLLQQLGVAHVVEDKAALLRQLHWGHPPDPKAATGVYAVLRTNRPERHLSLTDELLTKHARDAEHLRLLKALGVRSSVTVPLQARGRAFGVLQLVASESGRLFSEADATLFEQIAARAGQALDNARLYREAQEALRRKEEELHVSESLHRLSVSLAAELDPVRLVKMITDATVSLTGASFGAFLETRVENNGEPSRLSTLPLPRNTPLFVPTFRGEAPVLIDDLPRHPELGKHSPFHSLSDKHLPVRSYLAVAVKSRSGEVLGGLFLVHPEPQRFTRVHAQLTEGIATQAATALDNARQYAGLRQAEERFHSLINATAQVVWVMRPDGLVVEDSPSWRDFTGQSFEDYRGFGWLQAVHPEDQERVRRGWEAGRALKMPYEVELRMRRADGTHAVTVWHAVPLFSAPGEVREWVGTSLDVTAQRRAEEESRRLEREQRIRQLETLRTRMSEALSREASLEHMRQECVEMLTRSLPQFPVAQLWSFEDRGFRLTAHAGPQMPASLRVERLELGQGLAGSVGQSRQLVYSNDPRQYPGATHDWMQAQGFVSCLAIPLWVRGRLMGVLTFFGLQTLEEEMLITLSTVAEALTQGLERRRVELALEAHGR